MFPEELIAELQKLTDKVPSLPYEEVHPTILEACGPVGEAFECLEETPIAAASLSQVHRGDAQRRHSRGGQGSAPAY
ncbi:AarF/UbiB family protein [Methanogenium cariaci]|uniref:AarF/UbiB family protein n=1 Tax=Methanogenium cariaci TaxID=2197 RepID=UPI0009F8F250|nr:AarF/UbiB family protein [Methanogenium cariaci]